MILNESYSKDWIIEKKRSIPRSDSDLIEKMIYALSLVDHLVRYDLDFIFKGGTCLSLLLENLQRLSIDVDILTEEEPKEIETILENICNESIFTKFEPDKYRNTGGQVPKSHYFLFYNSQVQKSERFILLDVLHEKNNYPDIQNTPIKSYYINCDEDDVSVKTPTIDSIAGDKLTAFAPNTSGIPYGMRKGLQIIKQLFDLGILYDRISDLKILQKSFQKFVEKELEYRELTDVGPKGVLDDIFKTALLLSSRGRNLTKENSGKYTELQNGVSSFSAFVMGRSFNIDHAILHSAKVAYLAQKLRKNDFSPLVKYNNEDITDFYVEDSAYNFLNRTKGVPEGALFYWYNCMLLMGTK